MASPPGDARLDGGGGDDGDADGLAAHPGVGELYSSHDRAFAGLRLCAVDRFRSYLIVYRAADDRVEVLRVLHAARDVDAILNDALGPPDGPD